MLRNSATSSLRFGVDGLRALSDFDVRFRLEEGSETMFFNTVQGCFFRSHTTSFQR